jgi:hypothetical protein
MEFKKYQHVERFGNEEVQGIELGKVLVFPKIDGTNSQVWLDDEGTLKAGSRNRELTLEKDNAGFYKFALENENIKKYLEKHPTHRLYGEWLVPHSLKTYRDDAWRKFYIFDVCLDKENDGVEYIPYDIYKPLLDECNLDYIPPIVSLTNGDYEKFIKSLEQNTFMIKDGQGNGEGIVIKNYDFYNKYKRQTWAKIVTNEFKEKHKKIMGYNEIETKMIEQSIVDDFCTEAFIEKEFSKIVNEQEGWTNKCIPMLLGRVFSELIKEESWNILKKFKNPTINYKTLNALVIGKVKMTKKDVF